MIIDGKEIRAHRVGVTGPAIWDRVKFNAWAHRELTSQELAALQKDLGYDPEGYFGPSDVQQQMATDGLWMIRWTCSASCD